MEIDRHAIRQSLLGHADRLKDLLIQQAELTRSLGMFLEKANDCHDELTDDISKNPEKYGFLPGEKVQNYKIKAIVRQDPAFREADRKRRQAEYDLAIVQAEIETLKMRDADYRCLMLDRQS